MKSSRAYLPVLLTCSLVGYGVISYGIERATFGIFIGTYGILFACYYIMLRRVDTPSAFKWAIGAAILFRLILIPALPTLSDDVYRFIWDGNLLVHGINPFAHSPRFYIQNGLPDFLSESLFQHLNSQAYYTIYPPVSQYIYALAGALFGTQLMGNVVVMKTIMLVAEVGTFWLIKKLLEYFNLPLKYLLIYALNPLIILELTGNLHFEGVMIFFLLSAYYLFLIKRWWCAAFCFMLAVNTKLLPLILLPYLLFSLGWKRFSGLVIILAGGTFVLHIPFLDHTFLSHFGKSLSLYFQSFEFNASIYYVIRWLGFQLKGYDVIHTAAPRMALLSTTLITGISWKYRQKSLRNLPVMYISVLGVYYLFSTTVHPWYVSSLVVFVPLSGLVFPVVWSALIPLTYITYTTAAYTENLWFVATEYIIVFGMIGYDFYYRKQPLQEKMKRILTPLYSFKE